MKTMATRVGGERGVKDLIDLFRKFLGQKPPTKEGLTKTPEMGGKIYFFSVASSTP